MAVQGEDSIDIERQAYLEIHPMLMTEYLGHFESFHFIHVLVDHDSVQDI